MGGEAGRRERLGTECRSRLRETRSSRTGARRYAGPIGADGDYAGGMADRESFREMVRQANDIVSVVGQQVALRPAGPRRHKGRCPFHEEKTPSFHVSEERQAYHCFGCRESGDVFAFVMKTEGLDFPGALEELARRAGIALPERDPKKVSETERLRLANRKALAFFRRELRKPGGRAALDYLRERGIEKTTIEETSLGYAPDGWDELGKALEAARVPAKAAVEVGLVREGKRERRYDFFRNRLIVPIFDGQGRAAGFAGRSLDGSEPKYVNSPDSPIYHKRAVLYGLDRARPALRAERSAVLFEGYFDCLSAWQAGVAGAVAVCGTALSAEQARLLATSCREVVLAFDSDAAGRRAARAAIPVLLAAGLSVRVARFADGRDPDDELRERGGAAFRQLLAAAPRFLDFLVDEALLAPPGSASGGRVEAAREVAAVIAGASDPLARDEWMREAAGPLGFSPEAFREEVERQRRRAPASGSGGEGRRAGAASGDRAGEVRTGGPAPAAPKPTPVERDLIRWAERRPGEVARLLLEAPPADLEGLAVTPLLRLMREAAEREEADRGAEPTWAALLGERGTEPGPVQRLLAEIQLDPVGLDEETQSPADCFVALRLRRLQGDLQQLKGRAGAEGDDAGETLLEIQRVIREIQELRAPRG